MIVLDRRAEAPITGAAQVRDQIAGRQLGCRRSTLSAPRRELKLQKTLLVSMIRQFEIAQLDEGPQVQTVDTALPPDHKSRPSRALVVLGSTLAALLVTNLWVVVRRYGVWVRKHYPQEAPAREALSRAWRLRGG